MTLMGVPMTILEQAQPFARVRCQVAKILLEQTGNSVDGHNRLTQRDMATMLGTGWDMIHVTLKALNQQGIIKIDRNRIIINKELLQKVAGG